MYGDDIGSRCEGSILAILSFFTQYYYKTINTIDTEY